MEEQSCGLRAHGVLGTHTLALQLIFLLSLTGKQRRQVLSVKTFILANPVFIYDVISETLWAMCRFAGVCMFYTCGPSTKLFCKIS